MPPEHEQIGHRILPSLLYFVNYKWLILTISESACVDTILQRVLQDGVH